MTEKHTPGPWASNDFGEIVAENGFIVANIPPARSRGKDGTEEFKIIGKNRLLIATAPELLNALRELIDAGDNAVTDEDGTTAMLRFASAYQVANSIIKKATGAAA